jgi:lipopolysaccharide export system permease protein
MTLLDKYVLNQMIRRLVIAMGIVIVILLLERVLRIIEFAAENNIAFLLVLEMTANLLPHYIGLALPSAFFISILLLMAQLGDNSELDIILGTGKSVGQIAKPMIIFGCILAMLSVALLGYLQPLSRYGYRTIRHVGANALWSEAITNSRFYTPSNGVTVFSDGVDPTGTIIEGVFVHQVDPEGIETTITAKTGHVETDVDQDQAKIMLQDVVQIVKRPEQPPTVLYLKSLDFTPDFSLKPVPFRPRGNDARELTLTELARLYTQDTPETADGQPIEEGQRNSELHARLVRSASVAIMPFLAIPMGIAAKRRRRGAAIATASVMLLMYHYTLQLGEGFVGLGHVSAFLGLWLPFLLFSFFCVNLLYRADQRLRPDPFEKIFDGLHSIGQLLRSALWFMKQPEK